MKPVLNTVHNMTQQILEMGRNFGKFIVVTKMECFIQNVYMFKKMKWEGENWIQVTPDMFERQAFANRITKLQIPLFLHQLVTYLLNKCYVRRVTCYYVLVYSKGAQIPGAWSPWRTKFCTVTPNIFSIRILVFSLHTKTCISSQSAM
jgi:hypothetical protein